MSYSWGRREIVLYDGDAVSDDFINRFVHLSGDVQIKIYAKVESGSYAVRLDGDTTDRTTIAKSGTTSTDYTEAGFSIMAETADKLRTICLLKKTPSSSLSYFEIHVRSNN